MRLWSIHPRYLDPAGLVALWREALLAQKVLKGKTKGFKNHPQLERFKNHSNPQKVIANYLVGIWKEARRRGYNFDKGKIKAAARIKKMQVSRSQLKYEFDWLRDKLKKRNPQKYRELFSVERIESHLIFEIIEGEIEEWEKMKSGVGQQP
jgi:Glu-tRNA(Gln) amidotransferase subunit E-like FAD-binding protein